MREATSANRPPAPRAPGPPRPPGQDERLESLPKGYLFGFLLALAFLPPDYRFLYLPSFGGIIFSAKEISLMALPVVYYFFYPDRKLHVISPGLRQLIFLFFGAIVLAEFLKMGFYRQSVGDIAKSVRVGIPLFSGLLILVQGVKLNPKWCVSVFLSILALSMLLTPIMPFLGLDGVYRDLGDAEIELEVLKRGRIFNQNFPFALIGVAALFVCRKWGAGDRAERRLYHLVVALSCLSVLVAVLSFNRTFLAGMALVGVICSIRYFQASRLVKGGLIVLIAIGPALAFYNTSEEVQRQVDTRILEVLEDRDVFLERIYYQNRAQMYEYYWGDLKQFWSLGLPGYRHPWVTSEGTSSKTDISLYNIWIKYGLGALVVFVVFWAKFYRSARNWLGRIQSDSIAGGLLRAVVVAFPVYLLASLNMDVLVHHNAGFYILFLMTFTALWSKQRRIAPPHEMNRQERRSIRGEGHLVRSGA